MTEIRDLPPNGFDAVSTFSGCGGSSLGYRMAGFRVLWASEFVPAARDTYRANAAPYTVLDGRDIREVTGADILTAIGKPAGELDLLDGSPPCASFSTAGKRDKGWGEVKAYSDTVQRADDLFFEFTRILREVQPRTFIAENVSGLVKGTAKGYFKLILTELQTAGYRVAARVLDASWLGVPQARQRLIFTGVRSDLGVPPVHPVPLSYRYTVRDVLPWITAQAYPQGYGRFGSMVPPDRPSATFGSMIYTGNGYWPPGFVTGPLPDGTHSRKDPETGGSLTVIHRKPVPGQGPDTRKLTLAELRVLSGFPPDFVLTGTYAQRWERIGRAVPPVMMAAIATAVRDQVLVPLREQGVI
jgi:DNA (cytosine-5)-methyltransferase 1